ncbi:hypothetical protein BDV96DRAFT_460006, partial [Lophiotrema nucula]
SQAAAPAGIRKTKRKVPRANKSAPSTLDRHFWYTSSDGVVRIAPIADQPDTAIQQVNTYYFNPDLFIDQPYPQSLEPGHRWPPVNISDIVQPPRYKHTGFDVCVGDQCYTSISCRDFICKHSLEDWEAATNDWEKHFELRQTRSRGIGVYTKSSFKTGDVLGWYAGEVKPVNEYGGDDYGNDYLMELEIGEIPESSSRLGSEYEPTNHVIIDSKNIGNWTRFINHSCEPYASFVIRRIGDTRIMSVEAIDDIPAGAELTVNYGPDYYGLETKKVCRCGTPSCVGKRRKKK